MSPDRLGTQLRHSQRDFLPQRRKIAALALAQATCMGVVAAYQIGLIARLPGPSMAGLKSEAVNGSPQAYSILQAPDAVLGFAASAAALGLASIGDADRYRDRPLLGLLPAIQAAGGTAIAAKLLADQPLRHKNISLWSVAGALCMFAMAAFSAPEARAALGSAIESARDRDTGRRRKERRNRG